MKSGKSPRRRAWPASIAAAAALFALAPAGGALIPASALAAVAPPSDGALSPRLAELAEPAVRTAPPAEQARALSLAAEGPGSLVRDGNRVLVEVRFDQGAASGVEDLRQAGAEIVNVSRQYQTVTVAAKPDELRALNGVAHVAGAREVLKPITAAAECPSGEVVSEGVQQMKAGNESDEARGKFEVDGEGVTVGILSDSFNQASESLEGGEIATHQEEDVTNGDLPGEGNPCGDETEVDVLEGADPDVEGADEGRAMAQIVHDVAPGANLAFATAFTPDMFGFAENIERLAAPLPGGANANVIADDVVFFEEPFFQEGPVAAAVRKVTEEDEVTYLSAAGNDNLIDESGNDIASWEAPAFRDAHRCPVSLEAIAGLGGTHCMDFDPREGSSDETLGIDVENGRTLTIDLQWSEPWFGVETDLDAFLLNSAGEPLTQEIEGKNYLVGSAYDNTSTQKPFEFFQWKNTGPEQEVQLVVNRCSGGCNPAASATRLPRLKIALLENGRGVSATEYPESKEGDIVGPTVFGHTGAKAAISVAAAPVPSFSPPELEEYSSRGPVTNYYGPVADSSPAPELPAPEVISKPDLTASDCGVTTFFSFKFEGAWRFCGTSAAAPHAAGVAALMFNAKEKETGETAGPDEIRTALMDGADPIGSFGPCAAGAGLIDSVAAIEHLLTLESVAREPCTAPASEPWEVIRTETVVPAAIPVAPVDEIPNSSPVKKVPRAHAPTTFFRKRPPKLVLTRRRSAKLAFLFGSDQGAVSFLCKVDRGRFHRCEARFVRRYRLGRHVLRVKARRNSDGATDATPAVYRFRVKRVRHALIKRRDSHHHRSG